MLVEALVALVVIFQLQCKDQQLLVMVTQVQLVIQDTSLVEEAEAEVLVLMMLHQYLK